jgi:hypothetical protein
MKASPMPLVGFPLLLIPVAIYNMIIFLMPGVTMVEPLAKLTLMSGAEWPLTLSDMLLALGILLLMFEVIKGARPGAKYLMDHLLSLAVFGVAAAEFVQWPQFGTSTFFLLVLLALADFLSSLALRTRGATAPDTAFTMPDTRAIAMAPPEPKFDPAPAPFAPAPVALPPPAPEVIPPAPVILPAVQAAASVAEAVLLERPEPKFVNVEVLPNGPSSSQVSSPGLQPGDGFLPSPDAPTR